MSINPLNRAIIYIIDCSDSFIRAAALRYSNQEINFLKYWEEGDGNIGNFLKKIKPAKDAPVVFLHNDSSAATYTGSVKFEKSDGNVAITVQDLSELFSKANTQFFNRFNEEAKKRLGLDEVTVVLASSRIFDLKLNSQSYISPIGIKAKLAEIKMEQTFLSREILDEISANLPQTKNIFHIEAGMIMCDVLNTLKEGERAMCAVILSDKTKFFSHQSNPKYFGAVSFPNWQARGEIDWGGDYILAALAEAMGVSNEIALKAIRYFEEGKMSKRFSGMFSKVAKAASQSFFDGLAKFLKNEQHTFIISSKPLSFLEKGRTDVTVLNNEHLAQIFNYDIRHSQTPSDWFLSPIFALGLIAYLRRTGDNYLKDFMGKKLKWLQPENSI